jgi:hypothetical protein
MKRIQDRSPPAECGSCTAAFVGALASVLAFVPEQEDSPNLGQRAAPGGSATRQHGAKGTHQHSSKQNGRPFWDGRFVGASLWLRGQDLALTEVPDISDAHSTEAGKLDLTMDPHSGAGR